MAAPQEPVPGAPPPLPPDAADCRYFVGENGARTGPFDLRTIIGQIQAGAVTRETLLWKQGMTAWGKADSFGEFAAALQATPPPLPG
jgi:hypothetical protein